MCIMNKKEHRILPLSFYLREDVVQISKELLGKVLVTVRDRQRTAGIIVETEAYGGTDDRASHAFGQRKTERTEIMYREGGITYVYLIYGLHVLLNFVTNKAGTPHAVLIRALQPLEGIELMLRRRKLHSLTPNVSNGPAKLTRSLGITLDWNGLPLTGPQIWVEDRGVVIPSENIASGPRIGVDYAGEDARRPWRFWIKDNPFVSKSKG
jgi:DNA-3-methyladenine glycosylase